MTIELRTACRAAPRMGMSGSGRRTHIERDVYRILDAGLTPGLARIETPWSRWFQARPGIRARVVTPDGTAYWLDPRTITDEGTAEGGSLLVSLLPSYLSGVVVEVEVIHRDNVPYYSPGSVSSVLFDWPAACRRGRVVIDLPAKVPLAWSMLGLPGQPPPRDERARGRRRLIFELADLPATREPEPGLPATVPRFGTVSFATGGSWQDVARSFSERIDAVIRGSDVTPLLRAAAGATSRDEKIRRVLAGMAGLQYDLLAGTDRLLPRPPAETLQNGSGDCKDLSTLLVAALRAMEVPAWTVLLEAGEGKAEVEEALPGLGVFNHMIVVVPGSPSLWIDPSDPFVRLGDLPGPSQGKLALIADPATKGLTRLPATTAAGNGQVRSRVFTLAASGPARVVETTEYRGTPERALRVYHATTPITNRLDAVRHYVEEAYLTSDANLSITPPGDLEQPFQEILEMAGTSLGMTVDGTAQVVLPRIDLFRHLPKEFFLAGERGDREKRVADFCFDHPATFALLTRAVAPPGFLPGPLPPSRSWKLGAATFAESYEITAAGEMTALWRLDFAGPCMSPRELGETLDAFTLLTRSPPVELGFERTGTLAKR